MRHQEGNTAQLSTGTIAVQTVANVAAEEAAAIATTHELHDEDSDVSPSRTVEVIAHIKAELELEQLNIGTTAAQTTSPEDETKRLQLLLIISRGCRAAGCHSRAATVELPQPPPKRPPPLSSATCKGTSSSCSFF